MMKRCFRIVKHWTRADGCHRVRRIPPRHSYWRKLKPPQDTQIREALLMQDYSDLSALHREQRLAQHPGASCRRQLSRFVPLLRKRQPKTSPATRSFECTFLHNCHLIFPKTTSEPGAKMRPLNMREHSWLGLCCGNWPWLLESRERCPTLTRIGR